MLGSKLFDIPSYNYNLITSEHVLDKLNLQSIVISFVHVVCITCYTNRYNVVPYSTNRENP